MRILQVIPYFTPQMGGSATIVHQTCKKISDLGHQVTLVAGDYSIGNSEFPEAGFETILMPSTISKMGFYYTPELPVWIEEQIHNFDLIHLHEYRTYQNIVIHKAARKHEVPYVISPHGTSPIIIQRYLLKMGFDFLFGNSILRFARKIIAVSDFEVDYLGNNKCDPSKISLIYNGIEINDFIHMPHAGTFRHEMGIAPSHKIILFLGRLHKLKGIRNLILAFDSALKRNPNMILVIAGPDEGELAELIKISSKLDIKNKVLFPGPLYGDMKLAAYVDATILVYPSRYEVFGLVPFEAILCGTPVIATENNGMGMLLKKINAGYLVSYGDIEQMVNLIIYSTTHPDENEEKVNRGIIFIKENLNWELIAKKLECLYKEVINEHFLRFNDAK
jgi:glycosyltransferase involved in cell wall biosynthesis